MPGLTILEALRRAMEEALADDPRVIVLGEDVGPRGGVFQATAGLWRRFGAERVIDTPLAESGIVGVAIGAALAGLRPVAEIQFADFVHPAFNQIVNEAAKLRYRSDGAWTCPLVLRMPYGGVHGGGLYHGQSVEALFSHIPGLRVLSPSTPADAYGLLHWAIRCDDPVVFLEPKRIYASVRGAVPDGPPPEQGDPRPEIRRPGEDVTVVAYGLMLHHALAAAEALAAEEISVEVIEPRSFRPFDPEPILASVRRTGRICVVHEDQAMCGFGAEIAAQVAERALFDLDAPIVRLTGPDVPGVPYAPSLEREMLPSVETVVDAVRRLALS
jgi:2-oxoisovalerate dehydrogenase E1 component beta subunit